MTDYIVELDLDQDGVFETDITGYVDDVQTTTGRDRASQLTGKASPGTLRATVNNQDGRFSDFNVASPYYGQLTPGKGIRFRDATAAINDVDAIIRDRFKRANGYLNIAELGGTWSASTAAVKGIYYRWQIQNQRAALATGDEIANNIPIGNLSNLSAYWPLQEASGTRIDQSANAQNLSSVGGVSQGNGPGAAYPYGAHFAPTQDLEIGDTASLSMGDITFEICGWAKITSKSQSRVIVAKWVTGSLEYLIDYNSTSDRLRFLVTGNGSTVVIATANSFGSPPTDRFFFFDCWHDPTANTISIQINGGGVDSVSHTTGVFSGTAGFRLGIENSGVNPWQGDIAGVSVWKRLLTTTERLVMYQGYYLSTLDAGSNNCYVQATIDPGGTPSAVSNSPTQVGIVYRYVDDTNFNYLVVDAGASALSLYHKRAGVDTLQAQRYVDTYSGMTIGVLMVRTGITIYLEGIEFVKHYTLDLTGTGVGIFARRGEGALAPYVMDFRVWNHLPAQQGFSANLLENGTFEEQATTDWSAVGTSAVIAQSNTWFRSGANSLRVTAGASADFGAQVVIQFSGNPQFRRYTIGGWVNVAVAQSIIGKSIALVITESGGAVAARSQTGSFGALVAGQTYLETYYEVMENDRTQLTAYFRVTSGVSGNQFFIDDMTIKEQVGEVEGVFWTGKLNEVAPTVGQGGTAKASISASGPLASLARQDITPPIASYGKETGVLVGTAISQAGQSNPPGFIDIGDVTTGVFIRDKGSAVSIVRDIEEVEFGFLHETQEGQLSFKSRSYRDQFTVPVAVFSDDPFDGNLHYSAIQQQSWIGDIYNQIEAGISPYTLGASTQLFSTDPAKYVIKSTQSSLKIRASSNQLVSKWTGHTRVVSLPDTPVHANVPTTNTLATAATTHPVTMVASIDPGDFLWIAYWQNPLSGCDINTPSGWTQLVPSNPVLGMALFGRNADGSEDGTTVNITTRGPTTSIAAAGRVVGWGDKLGDLPFAEVIKISGIAAGTGSFPRAPKVEWDWGGIPTLVYTVICTPSNASALPSSGMTEAFDANVVGTQTASLDINYRTVTDASSYTPAGSTFSGNVQWQAYTFAIRGFFTTWVINDSLPQGQNPEFNISYVPWIGGLYQVHQHANATGIPITTGNENLVSVEDIASQDLYGVVQYRNAANLFKDSADATAYANLVLSRYKDRHPILSIGYNASQDIQHYTQAKQRRLGDRIQVIANGVLGSGLGFVQDFFIETIHHSVARGQHEVQYELSPVPATTSGGVTPPALPTGNVQPIIEHFGMTTAQVDRLATGYTGALNDAKLWFTQHVSATFNFLSIVRINATAQGRTLAQFQADAWGQAQLSANQAGSNPWTQGVCTAILVATLPYTTAGLGGAGAEPPTTGLMVKDGDALELFAKKHVDGTGYTESDYQQNLGMLIHELLHAMSANSHEDTPGNNVEWEWYAGANNCDIAPINRSKLLAGIWVA